MAHVFIQVTATRCAAVVIKRKSQLVLVSNNFLHAASVIK